VSLLFVCVLWFVVVCCVCVCAYVCLVLLSCCVCVFRLCVLCCCVVVGVVVVVVVIVVFHVLFLFFRCPLFLGGPCRADVSSGASRELNTSSSMGAGSCVLASCKRQHHPRCIANIHKRATWNRAKQTSDKQKAGNTQLAKQNITSVA
jgi:hypothetical protein